MLQKKGEGTFEIGVEENNLKENGSIQFRR